MEKEDEEEEENNKEEKKEKKDMTRIHFKIQGNTGLPLSRSHPQILHTLAKR